MHRTHQREGLWAACAFTETNTVCYCWSAGTQGPPQDWAVSFLPTNMYISGYQHIAENIQRQLTLLGKREAAWILRAELILEAETVWWRKQEHHICSVFRLCAPRLDLSLLWCNLLAFLHLTYSLKFTLYGFKILWEVITQECRRAWTTTDPGIIQWGPK